MAETDLEYAWFFRAEFPWCPDRVLDPGRPGKAEDVTQEAFIQLLSHWKKISRYERPDACVRRVAIRLAVKRRSEKADSRGPGADTAGPSGPKAPDADLANAQRLLLKQADVCVLFYYEDRPIAEIVDILGSRRDR